MPISVKSSAYEIVTDLNENYVADKIKYSHKDSSQAIRDIRDCHVFDFSTILMREDVGKLSRKGLDLHLSMGLKAPHPRSAFIFRNENEILVSGLTQLSRELSVTVLFWDQRNNEWENPYYLNFPDIFSPKLSHRLFSTVDEPFEILREKSDKFFAAFILSGFALLSEKSDVVWTEPAPWIHVEGVKLKGWKRPPPSVSIVHLNTPRILHPPIDDDGSGGTVRPHDRRAHRRLRGNRLVWVRSAKIHGGAPEPTPKVGKLMKPL